MSMSEVLVLLAGLAVLSLAVFYAMLFVFAWLTGWRSLAARYRDVARELTPYPAGSAVIGQHAWSSPPLSVGVDRDGITLRPALLFRPAFGTMHIPWSEIVSVQHRHRMFFDVLELHCGRGGESIVGFLPSGASDAIEAGLPRNVAPAAN